LNDMGVSGFGVRGARCGARGAWFGVALTGDF
jgi:hypothetical protein